MEKAVFAVGFCVLAYCLGSLQFGYYIGRLKGIDIRTVGSGSTGSTNIMRIVGVRLGILVLLLDMGKGAAAMIAVLAVGFGPFVAAMALCCAVLGHAFPLFLRFRGGKGVSTLVGGLFILGNPFVVTVVCAMWLIVFARTRVMSFTNLCVLGFMIPVGLVASYYTNWSLIMGLGMSAFLCWTHRDNIKRLLRGEEKKLNFRW